jgi:hypothetical protein
MSFTFRLRSSAWLPAVALVLLSTATAWADPILRSSEMDDLPLGSASWNAAEPGDELLITSTTALNRAAIVRLIRDAANDSSLLEALQPPQSSDHSECLVTATGALFNSCFGVPSLLPVGHYYFIPTLSVANGEFYWRFETKPVTVAAAPPTAQ